MAESCRKNSRSGWLRRLREAALAAALAAALSGTAAAAGMQGHVGGAHASAAAPVQRSEGISLAEAVERVRKQTGGRVLRAETRRQGGREVYVIRVLTPDGRVRTFRVDAQSGETR